MSNTLETKYHAILDKVPDISNLGICGAHRTGKTTLAKALSEKLKIPYLPINTSFVFVKYKMSPSAKMDIRTRLFIQQKILESAKEIWFEFDEPFICDRTPLDMAAYLLADVRNGELDTDTQDEIMEYLSDCYWVAKQYFPKIVVVPPAIPFCADDTKAAINKPLIHKLHCTIIGLLADLGMGYQLLPKSCLAIGDRVDFVAEFWSQK